MRRLIGDQAAAPWEDRSTISRVQGMLFALGGLLVLATAPLAHSPERELGGLLAAGAAAALIGTVLLAWPRRISPAVLRLAPAAGSLLVAVVVYSGGPEAVGAYAVLLLWVVVAAAYLLEPPIAIAHIVVALWAYAVALRLRDAQVSGLHWVLAAGTLSVAGALIVILREKARTFVTQLSEQGRIDLLTGLSNRRGFLDRFGEELNRARRSGVPVSVISLDLDRFRRVNDLHGRQVGDWVLSEFAAMLKEQTRGADAVARLGGEEFAVLTPDTDLGGARVLAERLRRATRDALEDIADSVTVSCGVAGFPHHGATPEGLIEAAEEATSTAKRLGRDRCVEYRARELAGGGATAERGLRFASLQALAAEVGRGKGGEPESWRVALYSDALAHSLGLPAARRERVRLAGMLCDVGEIGVPARILTKTGPLTAEEWEHVSRHPEIGARLAIEVGLDDLANWILCHQERPDGRGYPFGLTAERIPVEARILAVAAACSAMQAGRPYRPPLSPADLRLELWRGAGTQFDGDVVEALLAIVPGS